MKKFNSFDFSSLPENLTTTNANPQQLKILLANWQKKIDAHYTITDVIMDLLHWRSKLLDYVLQFLWEKFLGDIKEFCLIAIGSYGRQELYPCSDVDILILTQIQPDQIISSKINKFLTTIWDIGLIVGHSVRLDQDCLQQSMNDVTIYTNLLEMRFINGNQVFFDHFQQQFQSQYFWQNNDFFKAKADELNNRKLKYSKTAYLLEPDLKYSPGSLRDIHHIKWLCLQYFKTANIFVLVENNILDQTDYEILLNCEAIIGIYRYGLHLINQKPGNRLFFDAQLLLARKLNTTAQPDKEAIESLMKNYFIHAKEIRALHEIVTNDLYERSLEHNKEITVINRNFEQINHFISIRKHISIEKKPQLILQVFLQLSTCSNISGFTAYTLRILRKHLYLINDAFRNDPANQKLFIKIFKSKRVFEILKEMNRHRILGSYLSDFDQIIGQTQYGIFHLYTVDHHILYVIHKIESLQQTDSFYQQLFNSLPHPYLLYLAALFHDIGKGHNTDHSIYGFHAALNFAKQHNLSQNKANLIAWLVKAHLLMSQTAQKKNINDLKVIAEFAKEVKSINRLNYLYLLTVADIQATNETLWNSWKDSLLKQLYLNTVDFLENPIKDINLVQQVNNKKLAVLAMLPSNIIESSKKLWEEIDAGYFQNEQAQLICWHALEVAHADLTNDKVHVAIRTVPEHGATEIFICCNDRDNLFANTVLLLDHLELNIVNAKILTSSSALCLDTFSVLDRENRCITDATQLLHIQQILSFELSNKNSFPKFTQRYIPRQLIPFINEMNIRFKTLLKSSLTQLTIKTTDRPGLLAGIGNALREYQIRVHNAKISTIGTQVDDIFYITDLQNNPINNQTLQIELIQAIKHYTLKP